MRRALDLQYADNDDVRGASWVYGSLVHLVFPNGRGVPDGYYARSYGPKGSKVMVSDLRIQDMVRLTLGQMQAGDLFQFAELGGMG